MACQLDYLCLVRTDRKRREALKNLPPDLDKTYQRILERVSEPQAEMVIMTLNLIAYAQEPLTVEELCEALSAPSDQSFLEKEEYIPLEEVLDSCSSLVHKSNDGLRLEFAHASVLQYLESSVLCESVFSRFHLSRKEGYRILARKCLEFIHLKNFAHKLELELFPFHRHACFWWTTYASSHMSDALVLSLAKRLFYPSQTQAYTNWISSFRTRLEFWQEDLLVETPAVGSGIRKPIRMGLDFSTDFSPLFMAALLALPEICEFLISEFKISASYQMAKATAAGPQLSISTAYGRLEWSEGSHTARLSRIDMGTTPEGVQKTLSLLTSSTLSIADMSPIEIDGVLESLITRSRLINRLFLVPAAELMAQLISSCPGKLAGLLETAAALEVPIRRIPLHDPDEAQRLENEFYRVVHRLGRTAAHYPVAAKLCSTIFNLSMQMDLNFVRDAQFISTQISFSEEALVESLFAAVYQDHSYFVKEAVKDPRLDIPKLVRKKWSLVELAVNHASALTLKLLLDAGCSVLPQKDSQTSPLHIWAQRIQIQSESDHEATLRLLLDRGASSSALDGAGATALHAASNNFRSLQTLLKVEDENHTLNTMTMANDFGDTPLAAAFKSRNEACVLLLLSLEGVGTAHFQSKLPIFTLAAKLGRHAVTQKLVDMHWDPSLPDDGALCPLHYLFPMITPRCLRHLLELYGSTCQSRCCPSLLGEFIERGLLWRNNTGVAQPIRPDKYVIEALYRVDSAAIHVGRRVTVWNDVVAAVARRVAQYGPSSDDMEEVVELIIQILLDLGAVEAYESATGRSCVVSLLAELPDIFISPSVYVDKRGSPFGSEISVQDQYRHPSDSVNYIQIQNRQPYHSENKVRMLYQDPSDFNGEVRIQRWHATYPIGPGSWLRLLHCTKQWSVKEEPKHFGTLLQIALSWAREFPDFRLVAQYMLQHEVDIHFRVDGYSALERTCLEQRVDQELFQQVVDVADPARLNDTNPLSGGLLHLISELQGRNTVYMIKELIRRGVDPNLYMKDSLVARKSNPLALQLFLRRNCHEAACALIDGNADPTLKDSVGFDAALTAAWVGDTAFLEKLRIWESRVDSRAIPWGLTVSFVGFLNLDRDSGRGLNGLHLGALQGYREVVSFYTKMNLADINSRSFVGGTAMHYATVQRGEDIIRFLEGLGASLKIVDSFQELPIHWAVRLGNVDAVKTLISLGSPQSKNAVGNTPHELAVLKGAKDVIECFQSLEAAQNGQDIPDNAGMKAVAREEILYRAIEKDDVSTVKKVVESGLPVDTKFKSYDYHTPLLVAVSNNSVRVVSYLLERGAKVATSHPHEGALDRAIADRATAPIVVELLDRHLRDPTKWREKPSFYLRLAVTNKNYMALDLMILHILNNSETYAQVSPSKFTTPPSDSTLTT